MLRRYPGKVPDLEMMFDCVDWPVVKSSDHSGHNAIAPPALFRYCGDDDSLDIVFPDWSFWGWYKCYLLTFLLNYTLFVLGSLALFLKTLMPPYSNICTRNC